MASADSLIFGPSDALDDKKATASAGRYVIGGRDLMGFVEIETTHDPETGQYVAVVEEWSITGVGDTLPEAIEDLREALRAYYEVLESTDSISAALHEQRAFLRAHVRPVPAP